MLSRIFLTSDSILWLLNSSSVELNLSENVLYCDSIFTAAISPVLKICFGPPTAESKNLKNHVNFDVGDLFFRSPALWSSQNVFGPPTAGCVVVDFKDRDLGVSFLAAEFLGHSNSCSTVLGPRR